jgi:hypothetical protein
MINTYIEFKEFSLVSEALNRASNSMDAQDFYEFVFSTWHPYKNGFEGRDGYFQEKWEIFRSNPVHYFSRLSPDAYEKSIKGFLSWYNYGNQTSKELLTSLWSEEIENEEEGV